MEDILIILLIMLTSLVLFYTFLLNFKNDINKKIDSFLKNRDLKDERIFLLATGKTLREAMIEVKKNEEERKK